MKLGTKMLSAVTAGLVLAASLADVYKRQRLCPGGKKGRSAVPYLRIDG